MENTQQLVIPLWPEGAPGSESWEQVEEEMVLGDWNMPIVRNITQPSLTVYRAGKPNGAAVIIAPGGAFHFLAIEHEGRQVAAWLSSHGITALILKYRVLRTGADIWKEVGEFMANREAKAAEMAALMAMTQADAGKAIQIVRQRAGEWGVDPRKVGLMGFSAGGMVTSQAALSFAPGSRPDFAAPIYGAIFDEVVAPPDAPPLFLLCAQDDEMASNGSLLMYSAWKAAKCPVEMHIYASGGHGFGMRKLGLPCDTWIERFEEWLQGLGIV